MIVLGVAAAAVIGAIIRTIITNLEGDFRRQLDGTLAVNIGGSFLLGLLASSDASTSTLAMVGVGGLGALTTFSTYISQIECINRQGTTRDAVLYGVASLVLGISAASLGWAL